MLFISGMIIFVTIILSVKELGLVKLDKRNLWFKVYILGGASVGLSMVWVGISTIVLLITVLLLLLSEKNKIINCLVSETIALFILFLLDLLVSPIFVQVVNDKAVLDPSRQLVVRLISCLLSILVCKFICNGLKTLMKKLEKLGLTKDIVFKNKYIAVFSCTIILSICIVNSYAMRAISDKEDFLYVGIIVSISYFVVGGIIAFIGYRNLKNEVLAEVKERQLKDLTEYNENLEMLYNDMRKFRHDYINILSSMAGYIDDADMEGLKDYFEKRIVPIGTDISEKNSRIGLLHNIMIKEIKGVVLTKIIRAQELGISVYIDIAEKFDSVNFDVVDLSRCIGILLDNAIESAVTCKDGKVEVGFIKRSDSLMVIIINSFEGNVPPIHKIYEKGFSTKGENRGIGLSNLREVLSKYSQATLDTIIEENEFKQILEIC